MDTTDTSPPVIANCPSDIIISTNVGAQTTARASWREPTVTDNSGVAPSLVQSHMSGDSFAIGTTDVTYVYTDAAGNTVTCIFIILRTCWSFFKFC